MTYTKVDLRKHIVVFAVIYTALNLLIMGGMYIFDIDNGNSMNMPMLIASALFASNLFIKDNSRRLEKIEIRKLSFFSMLCAFLGSIFTYILVFYFDPNLSIDTLNELLKLLPTAVWVAIVLFVSVFYYFVLVLSYGWLTNKVFSKQLNEMM